MEKEQQEPLRWLRPVTFTHTGVVEKPCGLKRKRKRKHLSSVLPEYHAAFTRLLVTRPPDNGVSSLNGALPPPTVHVSTSLLLQLRLLADCPLSPQNLLAMVIAYFSQAGLFPWQYQRIHFFLAPYLANDMEHNQAPKLDMLFFLYGRNFAKIPQFHKLHYQFICCMGWDLRVTREECEEIQAYNFVLFVWGRDCTLILGTLEP
ncbi:speedy protein E4-like [Erethizon dorsatum]